MARGCRGFARRIPRVTVKKGQLSGVRRAHIRQLAHKLLRKYHIESPESIDVDTLAWCVGRLRVRTGGVANAEGRLVAAPSKGGVIRVAPTPKIGRFRFTVAHELGHYLLHGGKPLDSVLQRQALTVWHSATEETEANLFAAELLMPDFIFKPFCRGREPSLKLIDEIASEFRTSTLATAFQYCEYTNEPVALVVSQGWEMRSFKPFVDGDPRLRWGRIHQHSAAGERLAGKAPDPGKMVRTPAYAWLEGFDRRPNAEIMEDSRYLEWYDRSLTLLWVDEDLED